MSEFSDMERLRLVDRVNELKLNDAQKSILSDMAMNCQRGDANFLKLKMIGTFWGRHGEGLVSYANFIKLVDKACGLPQEQPQQQQQQQGNQQEPQVVGWQASSAGDSGSVGGGGGGGSGSGTDGHGGMISAGEEEEEEEGEEQDDADTVMDDNDDQENAHGNGANNNNNSNSNNNNNNNNNNNSNNNNNNSNNDNHNDEDDDAGDGGGGGEHEVEQDSQESDADPETKQFVDLHTQFRGFLSRHLWRTGTANFKCPGEGYWEDEHDIKEFRDSTARDLKVAKQAVFPTRIPNNPFMQKAPKARFDTVRRAYHLCRKVAVSRDGAVYRATDEEIEAALDKDNFTPADMTDATKYIKVIREARRRHRIARQAEAARAASRAAKRATKPKPSKRLRSR